MHMWWAYGNAGNGNEMETENGTGNRKEAQPLLAFIVVLVLLAFVPRSPKALQFFYHLLCFKLALLSGHCCP